MSPESTTTVWLAYVSYPVTTAVYLERALRTVCDVVTLGPTLPQEYIEKWQLQEMKLPITPHDIVTGFEPDMGELLRNRGNRPLPDLFLWITSVQGFEPRNLHLLDCPTACYLVDSHLFLSGHLQWASQFDFVFIAQRKYLSEFRDVHPHTYWLPLACDPAIHRKIEGKKSYSVGFVGGVEQGTRREQLLVELSDHVPVHYERCFWDEMSLVFSRSRIVFNSAVKDDLNMRFFEALSSGTLLLSDMAADSGQQELFADGEEYVCYHQERMVDLAEFYLKHEQLRERIAERGQRLVRNAHTYDHRVHDLLAVALHGKPDTLSAAELRERSLMGVPDLFTEVRHALEVPPPLRSFVIPVLDYSPASQYNILTLLKDLEQIDGEVIVVFNGSSVGEELKGHPRITRHANMKQNVGVARAWNIGISMAEAETVFIVNADAHITRDAVECIQRGYRDLPQACCVGAQGSFVDFALCRDYHHFGKGDFSSPLEVDAVSGFFFSINRRLCAEHGIAFDEVYSPCYFEEWDTGLQIRRSGFKSYIVPTSAYDHHWGGTIQALRTIQYLGREETSGEILVRNRQLFLSKWRSIARREELPLLLESGWKGYLMARICSALEAGASEAVTECAALLDRDYPHDETARSMARFARLHIMKIPPS